MTPEAAALAKQAAEHFRGGAIAEAESAYRQALALAPGEASVCVGLAALYNLTGRGDAALAVVRDAVPGDALMALARELQMGLAHLSKHQYGVALEHLNRVLAALPDNVDARYGRAVAVGQLGQEEEALATLRQLVADHPNHLPAHQFLNQLLYRRNADDEFLRSYDEAEARMPNVANFALDKASFLARAERSEEALVQYDRFLKAVPGQPYGLSGRAAVLLKLGRAGEAVDAYHAALQKMPGDSSLLTSAAAAHLMNREPLQAKMMAAQALSRDPQNQTALAVMGTAWRLMNDPGENDLYRYDRFVRVYDLPPPAGYADMAGFNRELDAELNKLHSDAREPVDQTLRNGSQTQGDLFGRGHVLVEAILARIVEAVGDYIADLPASTNHPFLSRRRDKFTFSGSWSSRLKTQGFHTNHVHPAGWISSAYYVAVPQTVHGSVQHAGWIGFGAPSYDVGLAEPVRRWVEPKPGRLVLFPSYMWHGTKPFSGDEHRTTIAFDVIPM